MIALSFTATIVVLLRLAHTLVRVAELVYFVLVLDLCLQPVHRAGLLQRGLDAVGLGTLASWTILVCDLTGTRRKIIV